MKISIPKVIVKVPMAEYAPELAENYLHVWVNPPLMVLQAFSDLSTELQAQELESARQNLEEPLKEDARSPLMRAFDQAKKWVEHRRAEKIPGVQGELLEWYLTLWNQDKNLETHWSIEELRALEQKDPTFLSWMITQTWKARTEHMAQKKKF